MGQAHKVMGENINLSDGSRELVKFVRLYTHRKLFKFKIWFMQIKNTGCIMELLPLSRKRAIGKKLT